MALKGDCEAAVKDNPGNCSGAVKQIMVLTGQTADYRGGTGAFTAMAQSWDVVFSPYRA
jgi:hypothetical protein